MGKDLSEVVSHLFVYGTLRRGARTEWARRLSSEARFVGEAQVAGRLYVVAQYPGLVRSGRGWVQGDLFADVKPGLLQQLDAYEGPAYLREPVRVEGWSVEAWVYVYAGAVDQLEEIVSGDWLRHGGL